MVPGYAKANAGTLLTLLLAVELVELDLRVSSARPAVTQSLLPVEADHSHFYLLNVLSISRFTSRFLIVSRLSYFFFGRASASSSFTRPRLL